jgi:hypothetical protein
MPLIMETNVYDMLLEPGMQEGPGIVPYLYTKSILGSFPEKQNVIMRQSFPGEPTYCSVPSSPF